MQCSGSKDAEVTPEASWADSTLIDSLQNKDDFKYASSQDSVYNTETLRDVKSALDSDKKTLSYESLTGTELSDPSKKAFLMEEMTFELKRLSAELKHTRKQLLELQSKSDIWMNPLNAYGKEIHLSNGTKMYGEIVDQDSEVIQVKTLIGILSIQRDQVVRIIDNVAVDMSEADIVETAPRTQVFQSPVGGSSIITSAPSSFTQPETEKYAANCVLSGTVQERSDRSGNRILSGIVKNIGGRRGDFIKVNFLFRVNWNGETRELTAFVKGTHHVFKSGISTDTSLFPGASGQFELYIPKTFGNYIGYSYSIEWEEHE
jgi:hypothetical protein